MMDLFYAIYGIAVFFFFFKVKDVLVQYVFLSPTLKELALTVTHNVVFLSTPGLFLQFKAVKYSSPLSLTSATEQKRFANHAESTPGVHTHAHTIL